MCIISAVVYRILRYPTLLSMVMKINRVVGSDTYGVVDMDEVTQLSGKYRSATVDWKPR